MLLLVDAGPFVVRDSVLIPDGARFAQLLAHPDGLHVYVVGTSSIVKVNLFARQIVATASRPSQRGRLAISPAGTHLYFTDPGNGRDLPGDGQVHVFDGDLRPLQPISLVNALESGFPPATNYTVVSSDGSAIFVTSGSPENGVLFPPQPGRLFIIDGTDTRLVRHADVGDWDPREVFMVP